MTEQIYVGEDLYQEMNQRRAEGQSFAGYIRELMKQANDFSEKSGDNE